MLYKIYTLKYLNYYENDIVIRVLPDHFNNI